MIKLTKNFSYKYVNNKNVFCITSKIRPKYFDTQFLSIPYVSNDNIISTNVLISYTDKNLCNREIIRLNKDLILNDDINLLEIKLEELKYMGFIMNIPIVVIIDDKVDNDMYEIYYYYKEKSKNILHK